MNGSVSSFDKTSPCSLSWFNLKSRNIFSRVKILTLLFSLNRELVTNFRMDLNSVVGPIPFSSLNEEPKANKVKKESKSGIVSTEHFEEIQLEGKRK